MTPEQLLRESEKLTYNDRMRRMVELGRLATSDASIRNTITAFAQGNVYQRVLATQSCFGSLDSAQALQALSDPSRSVRALSLDLAALVCSDAELLTALDSIPLDMKKVLLHKLHQRHRQIPIDMHIETLASRQDVLLSKLLPLGSLEVVTRHLGQVIEQLELPNWQRLARMHPSLAVEQLRARAVDTESFDQRLLLQVNAVLPLLTRFTPDLALDLVRTILTIIPLARLDVQALARKRPNEIADLVLQSDEQCHIKFDDVAHRLNSERLLALFAHHPGTISTGCFHRLTPQQRLAVYTVCERGWRNTEGILPYNIVEALPAAQRIHEGHRHQALPALTTRPSERLRYTAFLPWDEARLALEPALHSPDADMRGVTLRALITATRYHRDHLAEALQLVRNRRNEQDPVRREMLTALAELPYGMWRVEHLDDLAHIIRDALNATDLSAATAQAIQRIVIHLLPFHPEWSATQIPLVYRERGQVLFYQLDTYLSVADTRRIAPALLPVLESWQTREREGQLVAMARAFGKRLRVFDELLNTLEAILHHTRSSAIANSILYLLFSYRRERFAALIPRLLKRDKSCIVMSPVYTHLHRYRQDLITPFLGQKAYKGRFSTGRTRIVLQLDSGFYRWTPAQQQLFAQTVLEVAQDEKRPTFQLLYSIHQLAVMPAINPEYLIKFATDSRQPVRDAALRALGTLDAGQGIPTLLEALNDERARIAIYALRNSLLSIPQTEALNLLRTVSLTRVTVAKEVVRLIGDLQTESAYRELLSLDSRDLHRDVRVALLRALWPYVERSETWEIFARAAQSPDSAIARGVVQVPADGISPLAQRRLTRLLANLLAHPEPEVRMAVLKRCTQYPLTDYEQALLTQLVKLMHSPSLEECALAAKAVFVTYRSNDASLVGDAVRSISGNRRALHITIKNFLLALYFDRRHLLPTTRAILVALSEDRLTISLRVEIIVSGLPWEEVAQELVQLSDKLHADALTRAQFAIEQAARRPDANLVSLEMTLASSSDERLLRLALAALVAQTKQVNGWSDERISRLQAYRDYTSPLIAEAAQFTFTS
jgi:hypothetical protein